MLYRTITNNRLIVIFWLALAVGSGACRRTVVDGGRPPEFASNNSSFGAVKVAGTVESPEVVESSGLTASKCQEDLLWTHNDSGDGPYIFAMDEHGKHRGVWKVENAENHDWEDIASYRDAAGKCFLVVGDIGNSRKEMRTEHAIYRVAEPAVGDADSGSTRKSPRQTEAADTLIFAYPDAPHDAETLMVHPASGYIYIVTKHKSKPAGVYRLSPEFNAGRVKAVWISDLTVPAVPNGFVTGGEIAPDGSRVIICDYFAGYEFELPGKASSFDDVWRQKPVVLELGDRQQGEAVAYSAEGDAVFATSEGVNQSLLRAARRQ